MQRSGIRDSWVGNPESAALHPGYAGSKSDRRPAISQSRRPAACPRDPKHIVIPGFRCAASRLQELSMTFFCYMCKITQIFDGAL